MKNILTIPLFTGLLASCAPYEKSDRTIVLDNTEARQESITHQALFSLVKDMVQGKAVITEISDQSINQSTVITKKGEDTFLLRVEREVQEYEEQFKKAFFQALDQYEQALEDKNQSFVFESIASQCIRLASSSANDKQLWIFGDMLHHTDDFSFYHYRKTPQKIMTNYEQIVLKLESLEPAMADIDLTEIQIHVVYYPTKKNDLLFRQVRSFWIRYFQSKNAEVTFSTHLKNL